MTVTVPTDGRTNMRAFIADLSNKCICQICFYTDALVNYSQISANTNTAQVDRRACVPLWRQSAEMFQLLHGTAGAKYAHAITKR